MLLGRVDWAVRLGVIRRAALRPWQCLSRWAAIGSHPLVGEQFQRRAFAWQRQHAFSGDVRGVGAMQAMEFVDANGSTYVPAAKKPSIARNTGCWC